MDESIKIWFKEDFTDFDSKEGLNRDNPFELKRLNVLVGANNAGKSRFMREFSYRVKGKLNVYPTFIPTLNDINSSFKDISHTDLELQKIEPSDYSSIVKSIEDGADAIYRIITEYEEWKAGATEC